MNTRHQPIHHITELFAFDGAEFISEAYHNLLDRDPDFNGLRYYIGRLSLGYGKPAVIAQIAVSPECKKRDQIAGLKQLVHKEKNIGWLSSLFTRRDRLEKLINIQNNTLMHINLGVAKMEFTCTKNFQELKQTIDDLYKILQTNGLQSPGVEKMAENMDALSSASLTSIINNYEKFAKLPITSQKILLSATK
jgi:uncharacterized coiled-coil protein SlyX